MENQESIKKKIKVMMTFDGKDITFNLSTDQRNNIQKLTNETLVNKVNMNYSTKISFEDVHGDIIPSVLSALIPIKNEKIREVFSEIEVFNPADDSIIFRTKI